MRHWDIRATCDRTRGGSTLARPPGTSTSLIFSILPGGETRLLVMGPRTRALYFPDKDIPLIVNAQIRPGWARALTGVAVREIVDRVVPLSDLWGEDGVRLHKELAADPMNAVQLIERALGERFRDDPNGDLVGAAARMLPTARVHDTARELNVSERHLRTLFTNVIGVSPKKFTQIGRVRAVLSRAQAHKGARLATESGYYDQSHMTAEFRATMGVPLGTYLAGDLPITGTC